MHFPGARNLLVSAGRRVYALVPIKDPAKGKVRLAPLMSPAERYELCLFFAWRTLETCAAAFGADRTIVVTASAEVADLARSLGVKLVAEDPPGCGLDPALALGCARARLDGAEALLVVPTDLPFASVEELRAVSAAIPAAPGCLLVPDRRNTGTNLLGLAPARGDLFAFGEHSLRRHSALAAGAGCEVRLYENQMLALDVDLPEDFAEWRGRPGWPDRDSRRAASESFAQPRPKHAMEKNP